MTKAALSDTWVDAQQMHKDHPDTFEVPSDIELQNISKDDSVKVNNGRERFWVVVTSHRKNTIYGVVRNHLVNDAPYKFGDRVKFETRNVYQIMKREARIESAQRVADEFQEVLLMLAMLGMNEEQIQNVITEGGNVRMTPSEKN